MSSSYQTKMYPSAWMHGLHQRASPASQATPQHNLNMVRNQQTENASSSRQYWTVKAGGQQAQSADYTLQNGTNRQTSNYLGSVNLQRAAVLQQPTGGRNNTYFPFFQNANNNPQGGTLQYTNGGISQQQFHHSPSLNSPTQAPHGMQRVNTAYGQQDNLSYCNQPFNGKQFVHVQNSNVQGALHQSNGNTDVLKPAPSYTATGTAVRHEQAACAGPPVSGTAYTSMRPTVHAHSPRQSSVQHSSASPCFQETGLQFFRNDSNVANSYPIRQFFNVAIQNPMTQQYTPQLNTVQSAGNQTFGCGDSVPKPYSAGSNRATQPVTLTAAQTYDPNASRPLPYYCKEHLLKTDHHSVAALRQPIVNTPPQNNFDGFAVASVTMDKKADCEAPGPTRLAPGSRQENEAPSSATNELQIRDVLDLLQSVTSSDGSIHTSPGRTGTRAVAVVQPLSQESWQPGKPCNTSSQTGECATAREPSCSPGKLCISPDEAKNQQAAYSGEGAEVCSQSPSKKSSECPLSRSAALGEKPVTLPERHKLLLKLLTSEATEPEHVILLKACQKAATASEHYSEVQDSRKCDEGQRDTAVGLSSIPTIPWTLGMLRKLIQDEEKSQMHNKNNKNANSTVTQLLKMFWDDNPKLLLSQLKGYKHLMNEVLEDPAGNDSVILPQVKPDFKELLRNYQVLNNSDVYTVPPYKSLWLNVNEQLDDIDKECGFPCSLKFGLHTFGIGSQTDQDGTVDAIPAQTVRETPNDLLRNKGLETFDSGEEKQTPTLVTTSNESFSPNNANGAVSSEPFYSFEIEVLPPEEAKRIFQRLQSDERQTMDADSRPEEVADRSLEVEMRRTPDVAQTDLLLKSPSEQEDMCLAHLLETVGGSQVSFTSKCQCKKEQQSQTDNTAPKSDEICLIEDHSASDEETQVSSDTIFCQPELCSEQTTDLTADDSSSCAAEDLNNISYVSLSSTSEAEDREEERAGFSPLNISNDSDREIEVFSSEDANQMSDSEEDYVEAERTSTDLMESLDSPPAAASLGTDHVECGTAERQGTPVPDSQPESEGVDSKKSSKPVQLVLFGSSHVKQSSLLKPVPKVLSVKGTSLTPGGCVYPGTYSVKQRIREEWWKSFEPLNKKQKDKWKTGKYKHDSLSGESFNMTEASGSTSPTELPASSGKRVWKGNSKLSLKRQRTLSNGAQMSEDETRNAGTQRQEVPDIKRLKIKLLKTKDFSRLPIRRWSIHGQPLTNGTAT